MATLIVKRLCDLSPAAHAAFFAWIEGMTVADDWEDGPGFAQWLRLHATVPGDTTWVFFDGDTGVRLGTASLVGQDRELFAAPGGWVIGGVNVVRERRGQGIGAAIMAWLDVELARRAHVQRRPLRAVLQASNPIAVRLYRAYGFAPDLDSANSFEKMYAFYDLE